MVGIEVAGLDLVGALKEGSRGVVALANGLKLGEATEVDAEIQMVGAVDLL